MTRRILIWLLFCITMSLPLSACAGTDALFGSSGRAAGAGTVTGHVSIRGCPGPLADTECPARAMPGVVVAFQPQHGGQASTAKTDPNGAYSISLPAGTYGVLVGGRAPGGAGNGSAAGRLWPVMGPAQITVGSGQTVIADFSMSIPMV